MPCISEANVYYAQDNDRLLTQTMPHNIDTSLLRAFVAAAETGGMTTAARLVNLTQAAVSQQVKRLEEMFGRQLFERDRRGLRLTPSGERLLVRARRLLALNDEVWALMTAPDFNGEVRLGVPHDIVGPYLPPVLKSFDQAWPGVRVSLVCSTTPKLLRALARREIDMTLTTERDRPLNGETLLRDPLVWVGARDGRAYKRDPLPVSIGDEDCAFRPVVIKALNHAGRDWRPVCEVSNMESLRATVEADLAVVPLLASTVPNLLEVLSFGAGLPPLPIFHINLHVPRMGASDVALELSRHIREQFAARYRRAA
jgi:DNA-binding transcriptional LysR family regulator